MSRPGNPELIFVDYHVSGRRTAVDVHLGRAQLIGISLADARGHCVFFSDRFQDVIGSLSMCRRVYHDAVFARAVESRYGLPKTDAFECTRTMAHLLDENTSCEFDDLIRQHGVELASLGPAEVLGAPPANGFVPLNSACLPWLHYVRHGQPNRLGAEQLEYVYRHIELPLVEPILAMSQSGIMLDLERLTRIHESHTTQYEITRHQLQQLAGRAVELGSSDDVAKLLFEQLGLSVAAWNPNRRPSTDQEALEPLRGYHPAVDLVMRGRRLQAVASAAKSLLEHADTGTGRVYAQLDPLGAATGRLSCCSPNLQALPAVLLESLVAEEDHALVEIDFSQMELRVLAQLSQDPEMCHAFMHDQDIHRTTAARLFDVDLDNVTSAQREISKPVNFGIIYGQTPHGLATKLRVSVEQAADWIAGFYRSYPGVGRFLSNTGYHVQRTGFVATYFGRRRRLPLVCHAAWEAERQHALRQAVNAVVQGTAADLNKLALARICRQLPQPAQMLLNIHDAVLLQVPRDEVASLIGHLQAIMEESPPGWNVPLRTSVGVGRDWHECKHPAGVVLSAA